eukprot:TRINITY_DN6675_c0_g1_i1.p1 TRINITY_DN6675_c0_g1~~TRINITY_DN6675_c0_g1_i1.p1  ORF type:complete len:780 (-),score=284.79 TRINITY_DN6675_c0_g1_i1:76-2361(-)
MSRVIVKNLPKNATEEMVRRSFESAYVGEITDLKLAKNKQGVSRQFAFVGFKEPQAADLAIKKLNRTFIGTGRVIVQIATAPPSTPPPTNPKSSSSSSTSAVGKAAAKAKGTKEGDASGVEVKEDSSKTEFISVLQSRSSKNAQKFWSNDDALSAANNAAAAAAAVPEVDAAVASGEKLVFDDDTDDEEEDEDENDVEEGEVEKKQKEGHDEDGDVAMEEVGGEADDSAVVLEETGRLFVRNLPFTATEDDIKEFFSQYGEVTEIHLPLDDLKRSKGFAFVQFASPEHAVMAYAEKDWQNFQGRLLRILPGKPKPQRKGESESNEKSSYKKKKEELLKKQSMNQDTWNSLFLRTDTVLDAVASRYGVTKSDIVNPIAQDDEEGNKVPVAVRVALAETQLLTETRNFLLENGISPNAFTVEAGQKIQRSTTTILVKNLPVGTEESEIRRAFGKFGDLGRVLLPPAKVIAIVEYLEPQEARRAFAGMAYKKFKDVPLFLEWAPMTLFDRKPPPKEEKLAADDKQREKDVVKKVLDGDEDESEKGAGSTLFVKNLNFGTTEDKLSKAFSKIGKVRKASIVKKQKNGQMLSMGYGFIEFVSPDSAMEALKRMQGYELNGHKLELKISSRQTFASESDKKSKRKRGSDADAGSKLSKTKIIVKNMPFEANRAELRTLFGTFGQLKSVRVPKKFNGAHRGFAFIEFVSEQEAENAFKSLQDTHFYGRHLILQWAQEDENGMDSAVAAAQDPIEMMDKLHKAKKQKVQ